MQKIFEGGNILTMDKKFPSAEAILVDRDFIIKVGSSVDVRKAAKENVKVINLKGRTLMPGFIDAHGHFTSTAMMQLNLMEDEDSEKKEENANIGNINSESYSRFQGKMKLKTTSKMFSGISRVVNNYLTWGITTICEGADGNQVAGLVSLAMKNGQFSARYIVCPSLTKEGKVPPRIKGSRIINGPVKLFMDGTIHNYTAALNQPYFIGKEDTEKYKGEAIMTVKELQSKLEIIMNSNRSFAIHCNGDDAVDKILQALKDCYNIKNNTYKRNILIHCQTIREEQLDELKSLNLYPSFFTSNMYIWGEKHYHIFLGPERAARLNPAGSAATKGVEFTMHSDSPVTIASPLELVQMAVTRKTKEGMVLGIEQGVSIEEALMGVTYYAAYQYKMESLLGSIEEGKKADLIALEKNPLEVNPEEIKSIRINRAWVDGKLVWSDSVLA